MAGVIVLGAVVLGAAFVLVWLLRPDVRAWLEQPKHRFQDDTRRYDRVADGNQNVEVIRIDDRDTPRR